MYLLCSDWSIRSLEKEKEEKENCHLLITAVVPTGAVIKSNEAFDKYMNYEIFEVCLISAMSMSQHLRPSTQAAGACQ